MTAKDLGESSHLASSEPMTLDPTTFEMLSDVSDNDHNEQASMHSLPNVNDGMEDEAGGIDENYGHDVGEEGEESVDDETRGDENGHDAPEFSGQSLAAFDESSGVSTSATPDNLPATRMSTRAALVDRFASSGRPFPCQVCGKRFTQKAHLIIHKRIHTGEKPYACHICHKRFAQSSHLTVHKRVHSGEKPFFCNFCGMGFCRRPRLEAHVLQHVLKEGRLHQQNQLSHGSLSGAVGSTPVRGGRGRGRGRGNWRGRGRGRGRGRLSFSAVRGDVDDDNDNGNDGTAYVSSPSPTLVDSMPQVKSEPAEDDVDDDGGYEHTNEPDGVRKSGRLANRVSSHSYSHFTRSSIGSRNNYASSYGEFEPGGNKTQQRDMFLANGREASGLTMTGLVRTNSRVPLIEYSAPDIMQHLMSRDDVKSCDYCCIVFHDPAMYYLHRCMHDKMDVRRCNLCGKMAVDKYDFMAHFLSQHK